MSNKKEVVIDKFLENHNMDYLFCILAKHEADRLALLPDSIKKQFNEKITTLSLKHIAENDVPDYLVEQFEQELAERRAESGQDYEEEYEDDSEQYVDNLDDYEDEEEDDFDHDFED